MKYIFSKNRYKKHVKHKVYGIYDDSEKETNVYLKYNLISVIKQRYLQVCEILHRYFLYIRRLAIHGSHLPFSDFH